MMGITRTLERMGKMVAEQQKMDYIVYASKSGKYWRDRTCADYPTFTRALRDCRRCHEAGYSCWHIVRVQDGVVIAQSKNAKV